MIPTNDTLRDAEEALAHPVRTAFRECKMLAERLQMPDLGREIQELLMAYGDGGRNIRIEIHWGYTPPGRLQAVAIELVRLAPDVISASPCASTRYPPSPSCRHGRTRWGRQTRCARSAAGRGLPWTALRGAGDFLQNARPRGRRRTELSRRRGLQGLKKKCTATST